MIDIEIINFNDNIFPSKLREIKKSPKKLYVNGNLDLLNSINIAIVGTRHATDYGIRNAKKFSKQLTNLGVNIVSGMAVGIDTAAHIGCINSNGKTIAVLPCGFNNVYPPQNLNLYNNILNSGGLVISEYPPDAKYSSDKAVARNRIVAGLSLCTLIIEATNKSGTGITVRFTREQGKKVFCVPGNIENKYSIGTNKFIKEGASLLTCIEDITEIYPFLSENKIDIPAPNIPNEFIQLYNAITDIAVSIEELQHNTGLDIVNLNSQLSMLELEGYIVELPGGCYIRNEW